VGLPGGLPDSVSLRRWKASKSWARATCSLSSRCSYADLQAFPCCGKHVEERRPFPAAGKHVGEKCHTREGGFGRS
jgi:hypothetical protein